MASRKSGSDFQNSGAAFSYLDDVPFKIGDNFKSPAKVGFPVGFCMTDYSKVFRKIDYDFSFEKRTIKWAEEIKQIKAAQEAASLTREISSVTAESDAFSEKKCGIQYNDRPHSSAFPLTINPILASLRHNNILTPMPANSKAVTQKDPSPPYTTKFNLADFESEEDPFDKLELKTLNDKEELKNILEVQASSRPMIISQLDNDLDVHIVGSTDASPSSEVQASTEEATSDFKSLHKPNGLINLPQLENCEKVPFSAKVSLPSASTVSNIKSLSFPKLDSDDSEQKTAKLTGTFHSTSLPNGALFSSVKNNEQYKVSGLNGHNFPVMPLCSSNYELGIDSTAAALSSSMSDVSPVISTAGVKNSSQTEAKPANSGNQPAAEKFTINITDVAKKSECFDPLKSLTPSERHCAATIVSMGYSCENVIKAMQKRGENLEQILDYLFVHGRLCELGFEPALVEEGLEMYQCSEPKTLEFLNLMSKFREMGFERGDIKEVLVVHNNDQEKALEDLMTRAGTS
ncbi:ubiquitin-associated protein 1 [Stegostoma tigrinum]|uniref:ubiquitin-associated protein 1 n=1 Tax=Stegostoma tigrinum TaxID=3053191 RepID=UPI00202B4A4A|nr:ubiquitin-associated protein 1 [Stegostoma tigrinum]XP_048402726.1 ubiquitin-associated protein 1 [Stegostoma tigrinum]XP_048402735.1 ubiquitin-associated protein 1 [Stegostoma tigrinum]XP_048402740.1 ubiquitin-associated protein 1 [Stegostoma tigrinum]XP_048402749.1 ubiquitin-associated protein 1 [Stegostoma tigrinum]XP_048402758.1 ubiquitin-associated protein 1 [Stegostoma tigrinum]